MHIISERTRMIQTSWFKVHKMSGAAGSVFAFPCANTGDILEETDKADLARLIAREIVDPAGAIVARHETIVFPAKGSCECGRVVELPDFTNVCECGRMFNSSGQELAPLEQWGEETGERPEEILAVDSQDEWED